MLVEKAPTDKKSWINKALSELKNNLLSYDLEDRDSTKAEKGTLEVGLFMLNHSIRQVYPAAGTYDQDSGYWDHHLSWGSGIRGLALRRGKSEFFQKQAGQTSVYYIKPKNWVEDKYLLAVPIVIPPGERRPQPTVPLGFFKVVIEIFLKNIGVVTNHPLTSFNPIHPCGPTRQIKNHRNIFK